ncbi:MAG: lipocalin-like domain-containing protein [Pseudobdellovibrionaceae bacterium]
MKNQFIGTWVLESFEIEDQQGSRRPWGKQSHGLLIFTDTGHMSVSINRNVEQKSEIEAQNIFDSILFYSGTYSIVDDTITNHVTQASNPQRIGKNMTRFVKYDGNTLTLSTLQETFGTAHLIWKRIPA